MTTQAPLKTLFDQLPAAGHCVIVPHERPDGDALGACLALARFLERLGNTTRVVSPTSIPAYFNWLPGADQILAASEHWAETEQELARSQLIFCVDYGSLPRAGQVGEAIGQLDRPLVHIDHHKDGQTFADYTYVDPQASSSCEMVYRFIRDQARLALIDPPTAEAIYTGLLTDTGNFRFDSTTADVHRIVADLMERGCRTGKVNHLVNNNFEESRLRFFGFCLQERLRVLWPYRTAYMALPYEDLQAYAIQQGGTEGLVNYTLSLFGINFGALIIAYPEMVKMSFRSVGSFPANEFAAHFNGGGHHNAAGGRSYASLAETEKRFLDLLPQYEAQLNYEPFPQPDKTAEHD
jgi:phosphoesterase RecJ-like protein